MTTTKQTTKKPASSATKRTGKPTAQTRLAEGIIAVATPVMQPSKVTPENVPGFLSNIHIADAINNLVRQIYPGEPEVWVTDADGETVEPATKWMQDEFERLGCWNLMKYVIPDTYEWGCFVYSVGIGQDETGAYRIDEIRHLPAESFSQIPPTYTNTKVVQNPLMPGIIIDQDGQIEAWQTNRANGTKTLISNVRFVRATGTPSPSGAAFLYPCYFLIARMDFAAQAQIQQVSRVGAPRMIPKVKDDVTPAELKYLEDWYTKGGKFWNGKDAAILIPPGIEFPSLNIKENTTATDLINQSIEFIRTYCNPMSDLTSAGGLGQSDSGRMEMWVNFISSEQTLAEHWLEELFDYILEANGHEGLKAHVELKRPSIDRSAVKLQALSQAVSAGAITKREIRDNLTDTLELQEWSPEVDAELKTQTQVGPYSNPYSTMSFANSEVGKTVTNPEEDVMRKTQDEIEAVYNDGMQKILAELDADERTKADN